MAMAMGTPMSISMGMAMGAPMHNSWVWLCAYPRAYPWVCLWVYPWVCPWVYAWAHPIPTPTPIPIPIPIKNSGFKVLMAVILYTRFSSFFSHDSLGTNPRSKMHTQNNGLNVFITVILRPFFHTHTHAHTHAHSHTHTIPTILCAQQCYRPIRFP